MKTVVGSTVISISEGINLDDSFGLFSKGGSIGENQHGFFDSKSGMRLMQTFKIEPEAKQMASRRNKMLSPGERKYYGLGYVVKPMSKVSIVRR